MAYTLQIDSFSEENIKERTKLAASPLAGDDDLLLQSILGFSEGDIIYVGKLGQETCEKAVIASMNGTTTVDLASPLQHAHANHSDVTSVIGDKIRVYRAVNVDGSVPSPEAFTVLATREIDPDQVSTYFKDSAGSSAYWYCTSYYNETSLEETPRTEPHRGQDFGNYASLAAIRKEAGFSNAVNLKDSIIAEQRRQAQSEINSALAQSYTVPFSPVPEIIRTLTIQLAAALLLVDAYGEVPPYSTRLKEAREQLRRYADGEAAILDDDGVSQAPSGVSSYFGGEDDRLFRIGDIY